MLNLELVVAIGWSVVLIYCYVNSVARRACQTNAVLVKVAIERHCLLLSEPWAQ